MGIPKGFLSDEKWYEDLGHIFIGLIPLLGWFREQGQLPPATNKLPVRSYGPDVYWARERVLDMRRDSFGYEVGHFILVSDLVIGIILAVTR